MKSDIQTWMEDRQRLLQLLNQTSTYMSLVKLDKVVVTIWLSRTFSEINGDFGRNLQIFQHPVHFPPSLNGFSLEFSSVAYLSRCPDINPPSGYPQDRSAYNISLRNRYALTATQ